jgi:Lrp/AsnC family leucine-responsive transcriptional regulator
LTETEPLHRQDAQILALLQSNARISNADLAAAVGMSQSACWRRVKALEDSGVIEGYGAAINPAKAGQRFQAIVHVHLARHDPKHLKSFIDGVSQRPEVRECYATTGQADYHLRVLCKDLEAYNRFLETFLFMLPGVQSAQTNLVLREIKREGPFVG